MKKDTKNIGARLDIVRKKLKLTINALSKALGLTEQTIINYLKDRTTPPKSFIFALKDLYGVNPDWLEKGKGEMFIKNQEKADMNPEFVERLKKDLAGKDDSFYKSLPVSKEKLFDIIVLGKGKLSRVEVIGLARKLNQPVDEYIDLAGYTPAVFKKLLEHKNARLLFRSMGELSDKEFDQVINSLTNVLELHLKKHKKDDTKRER